MIENELATIAVDIYYKIHSTPGPGLPESVYEPAFAHDLLYATLNSPGKRNGNTILDVGFRGDIILEDKLLIEIKSLEQLEKVHHKIVLA